MLKKNLIFDVDGTLFNSIPFIVESFRETFEELEEEFPGEERIKQGIGTNLPNILGPLLPAFKLEQGIETYRKFYLQKQDQGLIPLFEDVKETLLYLKNKNYQLGIVTTKFRKYTTPLLESVGINAYFKVILGAEDTEKHKPEPDPLLKAIELFQSSLENSIYIGDALIDMQAARAAKMDFIAVTTGTTSKESFLNKNQKLILKSLKELKDFF